MKVNEMPKELYFVANEWRHIQDYIYIAKGFWGRKVVVSRDENDNVVGWDWVSVEKDLFKDIYLTCTALLPSPEEVNRLERDFIIKRENILAGK